MAQPIHFKEKKLPNNAKNIVKINKKQYNTIIGLQKIAVGIKDTKRSITDPELIVEKSEAEEKFDRNKIPGACWFVLDLETGKNIKRYFPGSEVHAKTNRDGVLILEEASFNSEEAHAYVESHPVIEHAGTEIKIFEDCILDPMDGLIKINRAKMSPQTPAASGWYHIWYNNIVGYVHAGDLTDIGYYEPFITE